MLAPSESDQWHPSCIGDRAELTAKAPLLLVFAHVWVERDGDTVIVNSEQKRLKVRNLKRDPHVSLSIQDTTNPYSYVEIRGKVLEVTTEGGFEGIDRLGKKYMGVDKYPGNSPGDVRVQVKIEPLREAGM